MIVNADSILFVKMNNLKQACREKLPLVLLWHYKNMSYGHSTGNKPEEMHTYTCIIYFQTKFEFFSLARGFSAVVMMWKYGATAWNERVSHVFSRTFVKSGLDHRI